MVIAFVSNTAWSLYNFRFGVMKALMERGYKIVAVAPPDDYVANLEQGGVQFVPLKHLHAKGTNPMNEWALYREFVKIYREISPDMIFHYTIKPNIYGVKAARKVGIPTIAITTGLGYIFNSNGIVPYIAKLLYKKTLFKAEEVWFLNNDDLQSFLSERIIDTSKTFLLPGEGVDTAYFSPRREREATPDEPVRFVFTGRMIAEKGVGEFVKATEILKAKGLKIDSRLLGFMDVLNPGAISKETMSGWEAKGIVKYLGATSDVRPLLEEADCLVLPSYYREGIPRSLLEAASMAKPIITTDNVGCRDVVDDNITGYLCPVKDAVALSEKMEQFIRLSATARSEMGRKGREKMIRDFDQDVIIDIYLKKIKQYIK